MTESKAPPIAVQLYTLRNQIKDFDELIGTVAGVGYTGVETVHTHGLSAAEMRRILDRHEVQIVSAHVSYDALRNDLDETIRFYQEVGNSWLVVPAPPAEVREATGDAEPWRAFARSLEEIGKRCFENDLRLGYHNHWWEMAEIDGKRVIDWVLEETDPDHLFFEPDLAWIVKGGVDARALLARYAGRCARVHVKDLAPEGENEEQLGLADVGHGRLDWDALLPAARAAGASWLVVEHDRPTDAVASIRRSYEFLRTRDDLTL